MRLFHTLLYPLLGLLCLSCSDDEQETGSNPALNSGAITFGVDLTGFTTRITQDGTSWTNGDKIGTYVLNAETSELVSEAVNTPYVCAEAGQSVAFTSETPLTVQDDGTPVKFVAYYPYNADIQDFNYPVAIADQSNGSTACDLLYGTTSEPYVYDKESDTDIALKFTHRLSKVVLKFMDMEKRPLTVSDVKIQGMPVSASFNVQTGVLTTDEAAVSDIAPYVNTATDYREAIILPTALSNAYKVSFVLDGRTREWVFADLDISLPKFNPGSQYTFGIYIDPTADIIVGRLEDVDAGNSSAPWDDGSKEEGTADGHKPAGYNLFPANEATDAFADTELKISFEGVAPELGESGYIRIYRKSDHKMVDEINMGERRTERPEVVTSWVDIIGVTPKAATVNRKRAVGYHAVRVEDKTIVIKPHSQRLQPDTEYYIIVDKTAINQEDFLGIYGRAWQFATKPNPIVTPGGEHTVTVSHNINDNADFYSLQGAIDYFAANIDRSDKKVINMADGIYWEIVYLRDQDNITIKSISGNRDAVNIQYDNADKYNGGINDGMDISQFAPLGTAIHDGNRSVITIGGNADKIRFENVTIENAYGWTQGQNGQAEAIVIRNDNGATAFINCKFLGYQDTILSGGGYNWYSNCFIAGVTDFIWGGCKVSLFENCEIRSTRNGRVINARTNKANLGYVFSDCQFTVNEGITGKSRLIESYVKDDNDDNITFMNTVFADVFLNEYVQDNSVKLNRTEAATLTEGVKMYNCRTETGIDFLEGISNLPDKEKIYGITLDEYNTNFVTKVSLFKGYDDIDWFQE